MNSPTPPPFGDPMQARSENMAAIKKGIGCGCGGCGAVALAVLTFASMIVMVVFYFIRTADGTEEAVRRARQHPEVLAALGEPIEVGWLITGNVNGTGVGSTVKVSIPLSGPKGSGTLAAHGWRETEQTWNFSVLSFAPKDASSAINLLPHGAAPGPP